MPNNDVLKNIKKGAAGQGPARENIVISTPNIPLNKIRANATKDGDTLVTVPLKIASGLNLGTVKDGVPQVANNTAQISFALEEMSSNTPGSVKARENAELKKGEEKKNTAVKYYISDIDGTDHISFDMDLTNVAIAGNKGRNANYKSNEIDKNVDDKNMTRIRLTQTFATTYKGVAGLNKKSIASNIADAAASNYLLSVTPNKYDANAKARVEKKNIGKVADVFGDFYAKMMDKAINEGWSDGYETTNKQGKTSVIKGVGPLKDFGVGIIENDGGKNHVYAVNGKYGQTYTGPDAVKKVDGLRLGQAVAAVNKIINAAWKHEINDPNSDLNKSLAEQGRSFNAKELRLANMVKAGAYATMPKGADFTVIEPAVSAVSEPYARSLARNYQVTNHKEMTVNGVTYNVPGDPKNPNEPKLKNPLSLTGFYGEDIVNASDEIATSYTNSMDVEGAEALKIKDDYLAELSEIVKNDPQFSIPDIGEEDDGVEDENEGIEDDSEYDDF